MGFTRTPAEDRTVAAELAGDWRLLLLVGTGLLIQVSHPAIGAGVGRYSTYTTDPYGRFVRSVWPVLALVVLEDIEGYSADLRAMHKGIRGVDHVGRRYSAWDPEAAYLVLTTAAYASQQVADTFGRPLTEPQRAELIGAWRRAAVAFGVPERSLPDSLATHDAWLERVIAERLEDHPTAHELIGVLANPPAPPGVPGLVWTPIGRGLVGPLVTLITVGTLPPALRETLGLSWSPRQAATLKAFALTVRIANQLLPRRLRRINEEMVRRQEHRFRAHAARGAQLGISPSIVVEHPPDSVAESAGAGSAHP